jgi:rhomboid protease GluP
MQDSRGVSPLVWNHTRPMMTYAIIALTVAVYGVELLLGGPQDVYVLLVLGAKYNPLIQAGQYWRLLTPALLHANLAHIGMNMLTLYLWGPTIETLYGRWKMLGIYVLSALMGTTVSYLLSPYLSVGASGAIFGLFGTLLSFGRDDPPFFKRVLGKNVIGLIVLNVVNGLINPGIDNWAHLGGLLGGFLAGEILGTYKRAHGTLRVTAAITAFCVIVLAVLALGPLRG